MTTSCRYLSETYLNISICQGERKRCDRGHLSGQLSIWKWSGLRRCKRSLETESCSGWLRKQRRLLQLLLLLWRLRREWSREKRGAEAGSKRRRRWSSEGGSWGKIAKCRRRRWSSKGRSGRRCAKCRSWLRSAKCRSWLWSAEGGGGRLSSEHCICNGGSKRNPNVSNRNCHSRLELVLDEMKLPSNFQCWGLRKKEVLGHPILLPRIIWELFLKLINTNNPTRPLFNLY